jgi:hypothetical protein
MMAIGLEIVLKETEEDETIEEGRKAKLFI